MVEGLIELVCGGGRRTNRFEEKSSRLSRQTCHVECLIFIKSHYFMDWHYLLACLRTSDIKRNISMH